MACVSPDGTLTASASAMLKRLTSAMTPEEIAAGINTPLFRVRSSLREMVESGLIEPVGDKFAITDTGRQKAGIDN